MLFYSRDYANAISQLIKKGIVPDVVVFNNAITGIRSYKSFNIPIIGMINDYSSIDASISYHGFNKRYLRNKVFQFYEQKATQLATRIIVNSKFLLNKVAEKYRVDKSKLEVLYKSINTDIITKNEENNNYDRVIISFVKSDWWRGGLDILLKALALLDTYTFTLKIVGPPIDIVTELISQFAGENTEIENYGRQSQQDIFKIIKGSHIFCTPARDEALGVANMEAMVHRIPVVYTNVGGVPEVMNYGENGFPCLGNDANSLASSIELCITSHAVRNKKIEQAYTYVSNHFNKGRMLDTFINICKDVIIS